MDYSQTQMCCSKVGIEYDGANRKALPTPESRSQIPVSAFEVTAKIYYKNSKSYLLMVR